MKTWKYSGIFLIATGIIHTIAAIAMNKEALLEIVQNGLINATMRDHNQAFSFWFLICGIFVLFLGQMVHAYIKSARRPAPLSFGYGLLIFSTVGCLIMPVSGFWLFVPQALIIILANKKAKG